MASGRYPDLEGLGGPYRVCDHAVNDRDLEFERFSTWHEAEQLVSRLYRSEANRHVLRRVHAAETGQSLDRSYASARATIEAIAGLLYRGRIAIAREKLRPVTLPAGEPMPAPPLPLSADEPLGDHWISLKLIDDKTDQAIEGVEVELTLGNGAVRKAKSNVQGLVELASIPDGPCTVESSLAGAAAVRTVSIVGEGESSSAEASDSGATTTTDDGTPNEPYAATHIAEVIEHKVTSSDTLEDLAKSVDMTVEALAAFNWGETKAEEIDHCLGAFVGCTQRTADGRWYRFDDTDDPGIIYLVKPWRKEGLTPGAVHTVRAKQLPLNIRLLFELDVDDPKTKDDTLIIQADDGSWKHEVKVAALEEVEENWVEVMFPRPPSGKRYSMTQDLGEDGDPMTIFRSEPESIFWFRGFPELELYEGETDDGDDGATQESTAG